MRRVCFMVCLLAACVSEDPSGAPDAMVVDGGRGAGDATSTDDGGGESDGSASRPDARSSLDAAAETSRPAALVVDGRELLFEYEPGTGAMTHLPTITAEGEGRWVVTRERGRVSRVELSRLQGSLLKLKVFAYDADLLPSSARLYTYSSTRAGGRPVVTSTVVQQFTYDRQARLERVVTVTRSGGALGTSTVTEARSYTDGHLDTVRTSSTGDLTRPLDVRVYTSSVGKVRTSVLFLGGRRVNTREFDYDDQGRVARVVERGASGAVRGEYEMAYGSDGLLRSLVLTAGPGRSTVEVRYELGPAPMISQTMPRFGDLFGLDGMLVDPARLPTSQFVLRQ